MQRSPRALPTVACLIAALASAELHAADDAQALRLRSLAATCAACHGTDGRAATDAALPGLAGRPAAVLAEQLNAFKRGARAGTVMPQLAKGYSNAQIDALAAWFAQTPARP